MTSNPHWLLYNIECKILQCKWNKPALTNLYPNKGDAVYMGGFKDNPLLRGLSRDPSYRLIQVLFLNWR